MVCRRSGTPMGTAGRSATSRRRSGAMQRSCHIQARARQLLRRVRKHKMADFNGLGMGLGNISRLAKAQTRSISAENFSGEKGKGGMAVAGTGASHAEGLGQGWKISPSIKIAPGETHTLADISGQGAIQH